MLLLFFSYTNSAKLRFKTTIKAHTVKSMKKIKKTFDEVRSIW